MVLLSSTSVWQTGIPYVYYTADIYPDGTRFRSGTALGSGIGDATMSDMAGDRVFHLDLAPIPEPLTAVGVFGAVAALGTYVRKRRMA